MDYQSIRHICESRHRLNTLIETKRNRYNLLLKRSRTLKQQINILMERLITKHSILLLYHPLSTSSQQKAAEIFQKTLRQQWKKKQQLLHVETTMATHTKSIERIEAISSRNYQHAQGL